MQIILDAKGKKDDGRENKYFVRPGVLASKSTILDLREDLLTLLLTSWPTGEPMYELRLHSRTMIVGCELSLFPISLT